MALNTDASNPKALCLPNILLRDWDNEIGVVALKEDPSAVTGSRQACRGAFGLCFVVVLDQPYSPLDKAHPTSSVNRIT